MRTAHTLEVPTPRRAWRPAVAAGLLALLSACGGGGGDGDDGSTARTLTITSTNRDVVAQTAAGAVIGFGNGLSTVGGLSSGTPDQRSQALGRTLRVAHGALLPAAVQKTLRDRLRKAGGVVGGEGMKRALATLGPLSQACSVSGSASVTIDDSDGNGDISVGETMTMRFNACVEEVGVTVNGQLTVQLTALTVQPAMRTAGRMTMTGLSAVTSEGSATLNGTLAFDYAEVDSNSERMTFTAETAVTTRLTSATLSDTVTLAAGYRETDLYEYVVTAPTGQTSGRSTITVNGTIGSNALGGQVTVTTTSPFVMYDDLYDFPSSGVLVVQGRAGSLRMTVLSTTQVRLELDADDNGSYESSTTVNWTWLV